MKRVETKGCGSVMQRVAKHLMALVSPRDRLGRKGFFIIFFCAILALFVFAEIARQLWFLNEPYPNWQFNTNLSMTFYWGGFALISGLWPLTLLLLFSSTSLSFVWRHEMGYWFLVESIVVILLYILYLIQCIRRCRDLGKRWYYCLVPLFNPFVLLFWESNLTKTEHNSLCDGTEA